MKQYITQRPNPVPAPPHLQLDIWITFVSKTKPPAQEGGGWWHDLLSLDIFNSIQLDVVHISNGYHDLYQYYSNRMEPEACMTKRKGKSVSFDAMVKFFMHTYNIPTRQDIERLNARLDRIERLIVNASPGRSRRSAGSKSTAKSSPPSASDIVLEIVRRYKDGVGFAEIQLQTDYDEKKLRNIIFRLNKLGKIKRKSRGIYIEA